MFIMPAERACAKREAGRKNAQRPAFEGPGVVVCIVKQLGSRWLVVADELPAYADEDALTYPTGDRSPGSV
jgi:hypothetical protein